MALVDLWNSSRNQLADKHVQQIIAFAGEGKLRDASVASQEFRAFLGIVPSLLLGRFAVECLGGGFQDSGLALQEVVNQVGRRLGFIVQEGRYRGVQGEVGYDGIWELADRRALVVEVKTTDAYRINLETVVGYRRTLITEQRFEEDASSILMVVGREDTGDLEAQIRGSRHAWDIRLIGVDALLRLMFLKEEVEDPKTIRRIHDILFPREFTKLDELVGIVFSTAEDTRATFEPEDEDPEKSEPQEKKFTPVSFHEECVERIQSHLCRSLVRQSRASYKSPDGELNVLCAVSKKYLRSGRSWYWFAFHPHQQEFLESAEDSYIAFGCGSREMLLLIPSAEFLQWVPEMNKTEKEDRYYWHVHIFQESERIALYRKKGSVDIDLTAYLLPAADDT